MYNRKNSRLTRAQLIGFWAAWAGWTLDGMDSFIYALVLSPAVTELLPKSGLPNTAADVAQAGSILFALFLVGWGTSLLWGPVADRFGRTRALAASILVYAIFTGAAALAQNVWQLGVFRFLAGVGIGGEWSLAGTYVAEIWPENRRKLGAGYLQTGYYAGFFIAAALNYTIGARYGWRAMFLCGFTPVILSLLILSRLKDPERWAKKGLAVTEANPFKTIFSGRLRKRTLVNSALLTVAIIGLWAGAVYEPTAIIGLAKKAGMNALEGGRMASIGTGLLAMATIVGCLLAPLLAERYGRRRTLAFYFSGMAMCIILSFGWAFYLPNGLVPFMIALVFLGFFGGNFAIFSLWLPEQYPTSVRATAFAFSTSFGRFIGAGVNFLLGWMIHRSGTLGKPVALTAVVFVLGLLIIPFATETVGQPLPE